MRKKITLVLLCLLLASALLFASDDWYYGKPIQAFNFEGLQNVSVNQLNSLLKNYIGSEFDDSLVVELDSLLYSQPWLEYYYCIPEGEETGVLTMTLVIQELPMISSIVFEGNEEVSSRTLEDEQNLKTKNYYSPGLLRANTRALQDYYVNKGYRDAVVSSREEYDDETSTVVIVYSITEGPQYKISAINFNGNEAVTAKELLRQMDSKPRTFFRSGSFVQSTLDGDLAKIIAYYNENGYVDAEVTNVEIDDVTAEGDKYSMLSITITLSEGPQWLLGNITFSGNEVFSDSEIQNRIYLKPGRINNVTEVMTQMQSIASLYYDNGYIQTQIVPVQEKNEEAHTIDYNIVITESTQSTIEKIVITGLTKTRPYVIERELELHVGDVFSQTALQKSAQNIMNTTLISDINVGTYLGETENGVVLEIALEEGNQMEIQFGATFGGTVDSFPIAGFLQWSDKNIFGTARNLAISTTLSPDTQSLSLSLSDSWVGDRRWSNGISFSFEHSSKDDALQLGTNSAYYNRRDWTKVTYPLGYDSAAAWYASDQTYPPSAYLMDYDMYSFSLGYSTGYTFMFQPGSLTLSVGISFGLNRAFYDNNYIPYEYIIVKYHDGWQWSNKLSASVVWDGRDLVENTTRGYMLSFGYTYAGGLIGGLSNYNRLSFAASGYLPLFTYHSEEEKDRTLVLSLTSQISVMLPQFWNNSDGFLSDGETGWHWYSPFYGTTRYEMLYLDGMNIGRGFSTVYDQSLVWHNQIDLSYPIAINLLSIEAYISATGAIRDLELVGSGEVDGQLHWYFSGGAGLRLRIPGFPLGLYLVKTAEYTKTNGFTWNSGDIFGMSLVLAITTSIY